MIKGQVYKEKCHVISMYKKVITYELWLLETGVSVVEEEMERSCVKVIKLEITSSMLLYHKMITDSKHTTFLMDRRKEFENL